MVSLLNHAVPNSSYYQDQGLCGSFDGLMMDEGLISHE